MIQLNSTIEEFVDEVCKQAKFLCKHHYIKNSQATYLEHCKSTLREDYAFILLNFAENYSFYPRCNSRLSLEQQQSNTPSLRYLQENEENLTRQNVSVISDSKKHDSDAFHFFLEKVLNVLKIKYLTLQKYVYFSDGAGFQPKNYRTFSNLCLHESDFGLKTEWNFFATIHRKSPCDGIGVTVKHLVGNANLQSLQEASDTLLKMFGWCRKNINAIEFIFVSHDEVECHIVDNSLEERCLTWSRVPGTSSLHWYKSCSKTSFQMHHVSSDDATISPGKQPIQRTTVIMDDCQPGKYIACVFGKEWFLGIILMTSEENQDVQVKFMM